MRSTLFLIFILALAGCGKSSDPGKEPEPNKPAARSIEGLDRYALGSPITHDNVAIVPVLLKNDEKPRLDDEYMSLAEAKANNLVEIREIDGSGEVSRLLVRNLSKKPLLLLAGQLLLGGKQDRVVAKDTIVPPGEEISVPVYCVEQGRWQGKTSKFEFSESMVPHAVRMKANFGSQQEVWDKVSDYNNEAGGKGESTSIRDGLATEKARVRVETDVKPFTEGLDSQPNVVGLVYIVNGEIGSFELFGNPSLLKASRESLLRGFLADAAVRPGPEQKSADLDAVAAFIKASLLGERRQTQLTRSSANWHVDGAATKGAETTLPSSQPRAPGDTEGIVHGSYAPNK